MLIGVVTQSEVCRRVLCHAFFFARRLTCLSTSAVFGLRTVLLTYGDYSWLCLPIKYAFENLMSSLKLSTSIRLVKVVNL